MADPNVQSIEKLPDNTSQSLDIVKELEKQPSLEVKKAVNLKDN